MWTLPAFCRGFFLFLCFMCEKGHHACLQPLKKCSSTAKRKAVLAVRKPSKPPKTQPEPFALPPHLQTGRTVHAEGLQGFSPCHRDQKSVFFKEHSKQISPSFGTKKKLHQPKGGKINSYNRFTEICPIFPKNRQKESSSRGSEVIKFTQECNQADLGRICFTFAPTCSSETGKQKAKPWIFHESTTQTPLCCFKARSCVRAHKKTCFLHQALTGCLHLFGSEITAIDRLRRHRQVLASR